LRVGDAALRTGRGRQRQEVGRENAVDERAVERATRGDHGDELGAKGYGLNSRRWELVGIGRGRPMLLNRSVHDEGFEGVLAEEVSF